MFLKKLIISFLSEEMTTETNSESNHIGNVRIHLREILQETGVSEKYSDCDSAQDNLSLEESSL